MAKITETTTSIFTAPPHTILLHACNAKGSWGAGVAAAFKKHYPKAYTIYHTHCTKPPSQTTISAHQGALPGTCLLIPPSEKGEEGGHWIACLFTSQGYGRAVSKEGVILENTRKAVGDLKRQIEALKARDPAVGIGGCWAVRINSGKFGVEWEKTRAVLEAGEVDMLVVRPEGEDDGGGEAKLEKSVSRGTLKRSSDGGSGGGKRVKGGVIEGGKRAQRGGLDGWLK